MGVGQQCCKGNKRYNPLPFTEERILREKNKDIGKKYIYFSTHKLTQDERERVFTEAYYKKKEIWLMDYSSKDYLEIFNMKKKKLSEELSEKVSFSCSEQKPQVDMKKRPVISK